MEATHFDRISKLFAERRLSRRRAMNAGMGAAAAAATLPLAGFAQEASPVASPVPADDGHDVAPFLFVQAFQSGTLAANTQDDSHTLTLEHGLGQTLYFGDRPSREVGVTPTKDFIKGFNFSPDNPPNAALIVENGDETNLAVMELFDPTYDPTTHTATYQVRGLDAWKDGPLLGLQQTDLAEITPDFEGAQLLIDDCPDGEIACIAYDSGDQNWLASMYDFCWNYSQCMPCTPYGHDQPSACATWSYWESQCNTSGYACPSGNCYPYWSSGLSNLLGCS